MPLISYIILIIAIILLTRSIYLGRKRTLQSVDRALSVLGLFLASISFIAYLVGEQFASSPSFLLPVMVIGLCIFFVITYRPFFTGQKVKKRLGKPCRIENTTQLYLYRDDLPFQEIVGLAKKEIVFVSITHEFTAPDDNDIIKNAILKTPGITVKVFVLSPNTDLHYQEQLFGVELQKPIVTSLEQLRKLKNSLKNKSNKLTVYTYTTTNFPFSMIIIDHVLDTHKKIDDNACMKIEIHPASKKPKYRPNEVVFRSDYQEHYDHYHDQFKYQIESNSILCF